MRENLLKKEAKKTISMQIKTSLLLVLIRKLAEQAKWMEEERMRELREERDDVTKKSDITDFYFNLTKNGAYGARDKTESKKPESETPEKSQEKETSTSKEHQNQPGRYENEKPESDKHEPKQLERHEKQPGGPTTPLERPSTSSPVDSTPRSEVKGKWGPLQYRLLINNRVMIRPNGTIIKKVRMLL